MFVRKWKDAIIVFYGIASDILDVKNVLEHLQISLQHEFQIQTGMKMRLDMMMTMIKAVKSIPICTISKSKSKC